MPKKVNLTNLDLESSEAAEGYEPYGGPLPETGSYPGILKIVQLTRTSERAKNPGRPMLKIGVQLTDCKPKDAIGYVVWRNLVLMDSVAPFINQLIRALSDGSEADYAKLQKAFKSDMLLADDELNIIRIGPLKINSPQGEIPVKVGVKQSSWTQGEGEDAKTRFKCDIQSFLLTDIPAANGNRTSDVVEEAAVEEDYTDESIFDLDDEETSV